MKPLLLLITGDADPIVRQHHGNFDAMFLRLGQLDGKNVVCIDCARGQRPDKPAAYSGVLVTGSPAMVTDHEPWSEAAADWLRAALDALLPIFGVCYGHQLLAYAAGGEVGWLADGMEFGTQEIMLRPDAVHDPLLADLPSRFTANLLHSQTVVTPPQGSTTLAYSAKDAVQILRYNEVALSTQFHPEFDGPTMRRYIALECSRNPALAAQSGEDTPVALGLMRRFIAQCMRDTKT